MHPEAHSIAMSRSFGTSPAQSMFPTRLGLWCKCCCQFHLGKAAQSQCGTVKS